MIIRLIGTLALAFGLSSCNTPTGAPPTAPPVVASPAAPSSASALSVPTNAPSAPTALPPARWDNRPAGREWTSFALGGLDAHAQGLLATVPSDIGAYCPRYAEANPTDRRAFWVGLMSTLARFESNFDPTVTFTEPGVFDAQGNRVISRGLLQISQESANGYGCGIEDAQQLHDPATNLACAARIMNRLVTRDGVIGTISSPWRGMAAYWSPFRRPDRRGDMQQWTSEQTFCR